MAVRTQRSLQRTAISVAVLVLALLIWQATATLPRATAAADPLPTPTADPTPTTAPDPTSTPDATVTPEPSVPPTPEPTGTPSPEPTASPTVEPTASASPEPSASESLGPSDSPSESPSASPSPTPTIEYQLSPGQRTGSEVAPGFPLWQLAQLPNDTTGSTPHTGNATVLDGNTCALCHSAHTAKAANLLIVAAPEKALCFTCHGSGSFDIQSAFANAPANDPAEDAIYAHTTPKCTDCHNPHDATSARPAQSTTGWTASGDIYAADGVSADLTPIGRDNQTGTSLTYEYELCFKCHSSATTLPTPDVAHPSWWALDAAAEFNPSNESVHPIEAAGRNQSAQMAASLTGTSPYKQWQFSTDSVLRCGSCHADPASLAAATTPAGYAPAHVSANRGLLIAPYRDRLLKPAGEGYQASDFALCYLCHAEQPFVDPNTDPKIDPDLAANTAFSFHGNHVRFLGTGTGTGTSIDTPGAGAGLATCAECHFRIHSSAFPYQPGDTAPTQRTGATGLVDFAPDVLGVGDAPPTWTEPGADGRGSCTLTCHGYTHTASPYTTAPAAGFTAAATTVTRGTAIAFTDETRYADATTATWAWDFGDSSTSTDRQPPPHTYTQVGTYTVSLTVTRTPDGLHSTLTRTAYITVMP